MLVKRIAACMMYVPIYLQPFPSNSTRKFKSLILAHFSHILTSPEYAPGTIAVNVTWMERGFNAGQTHSSIYSIHLQPFMSYIAIYWSEIATFSYALHFTPPLGVPIGIPGKSLVLKN